MELYFTTHYNWNWMITAAFQQLTSSSSSPQDDDEHSSLSSSSSSVYHTHYCKNFKQMPTYVLNQATKAGYSLFRVDVLNTPLMSTSTEIDSILARVRVDSPALSFMDPKDVLCRELHTRQVIDVMPDTALIPWDIEDYLDSFSFPAFPTLPALLKAPLGSGGFGLYFVYHKEDILQVIHQHRKRAEAERQTLASIQKQECYSKFPLSWSLQAMINPIRCDIPLLQEDINNPDFHQKTLNRKSQIRVYLVECNGHLYMYDKVEVRFPLWDLDLDQVLKEETASYGQGDLLSHPRTNVWSDEVEEECCGKGHARPYNEGRNKKYTDRYLVDEIEELRPCLDPIKNCVRKAFKAMKDRIIQNVDRCEFGDVSREQAASTQKASMAILGIDLLATQLTDGSYQAYIVEVNNNPAMPAENKRMSNQYKQHLIEFGMSLILLGIEKANGMSCQKTSQIETLLSRFSEL